METPLNAEEQECCLCQDSCNSVPDLRNHLQLVHNLKKSERDVYVKLSVEEKLNHQFEGMDDNQVDETKPTSKI